MGTKNKDHVEDLRGLEVTWTAIPGPKGQETRRRPRSPSPTAANLATEWKQGAPVSQQWAETGGG